MPSVRFGGSLLQNFVNLYIVSNISLNFSSPVSPVSSFFFSGREGGGVSSTYTGMGCAFLGVPFFKKKINFWI